jgi:ABC-type phosphate transport system auxiliary subunit
MSASSSVHVVADPSSDLAVGDVLSTELLSVQQSILKVEREIDEVGIEIKKVEQKLETPLSDKMFDHWSAEKSQLRAKEAQLRAKEAQLRAKEERLATAKNPLLQKPGTICDCFIFLGYRL